MEKGTILIVDDNKGVLASLELLLETEFSEIKTAGNPNQIISILNTSPIDVIILDMNFSAGNVRNCEEYCKIGCNGDDNG